MSCKSQTHEITITVVNGEIALNHPNRVVKVGDTVEWICHDYQFFVHLGPKSPLPEMTYQSDVDNPVGGKVQTVAPNDLYKYLIGVLYDGQFIILDPDLIVRR